MNIPSVARFVDKIRPGGTLIYNSSLIDQKEFRSDIKVCAIPANQLANEVGSDKVANVVMAGAYARFSDMMNFDAFIKAFPTLVPGKKKELLELNLAALKKGYDCANSTH
jgi:2-oxoglutarate ferredoxin oxidoreductase subunit gamma